MLFCVKIVLRNYVLNFFVHLKMVYNLDFVGSAFCIKMCFHTLIFRFILKQRDVFSFPDLLLVKTDRIY